VRNEFQGFNWFACGTGLKLKFEFESDEEIIAELLKQDLYVNAEGGRE
jgi:hypothetical protein